MDGDLDGEGVRQTPCLFFVFLRLFLQVYLSFKLSYYIQSLGSLLFAISNLVGMYQTRLFAYKYRTCEQIYW